MSRLLCDANADEIPVGCEGTEEREKAEELPGASGIARRLGEVGGTGEDGGYGRTASRVLGSPERWKKVCMNMGRLSPQSNEAFFEELQLGTPPRERKRVRKNMPCPPALPFLEGGEEDAGRSPTCVERTGAPAKLRRKARRLERGYRRDDVLRVRLQMGEERESRKRKRTVELHREFRERQQREREFTFSVVDLL